MTTQPTAAPWKVTIEPTHIPGIIRASIEAADGTYRGSIANLQSVDWADGIGPDEMTANAHLLGAAHDVADALDEVAQILAQCTFETVLVRGQYLDRKEVVASARAALAKARGQA